MTLSFDQILRRGAALLLLAGHIGWGSWRNWQSIDWAAIEAPPVDWITRVEPTFAPLREALGGTQVVGYVQLSQEDRRWNITTRYQLQYFLAPVLLDPKRRDHPVSIVEQHCLEQRCTPETELVPGRIRDFNLGLLLVQGAMP